MSERCPEPTIHLIERARAEDQEAMHRLFERFLPRVRNIAAIRLGRAPRELFDADDICQEAVTDAFLGLDNFDIGSDGKVCNWLATIVENRIRMAIRAGRTLKRGGGKVERFGDRGEAMRDSQLPGDAPGPGEYAQAAEISEKMQRALEGLPEQHREVLLQRVYCRMTYTEIAESLELKNGDAVRGLYMKALRELQERLGTEGVRETAGW